MSWFWVHAILAWSLCVPHQESPIPRSCGGRRVNHSPLMEGLVLMFCYRFESRPNDLSCTSSLFSRCPRSCQFTIKINANRAKTNFKKIPSLHSRISCMPVNLTQTISTNSDVYLSVLYKYSNGIVLRVFHCQWCWCTIKSETERNNFPQIFKPWTQLGVPEQ